MMFIVTMEQIEQFREDGFLIVENLIDDGTVEALRVCYERLFRGEFETGITPDEVNWREGESDPTLTRQICNGWKADAAIARIVLREDIGRAIAEFAGWAGARILQDNVIWKPPGARSLGYHQDSAYLSWLSPQVMLSCWIALDDTTVNGGTMEVVRGSHNWDLRTPAGEFHGPRDYRAAMRKAAEQEGENPDIVPLIVRRGGGAFHPGRPWHGSGINNSAQPRRSLVAHCIPANTEFVRENIAFGNGPIYGRYMKLEDNRLDENYFPVLWSNDGHRTKHLDEALRLC